MKLLDLCCCAGGAGMGYYRAGFEVVGVDIKNQPHYPFEFHKADALEFLAEHAHEFDAFHASPPCQRFSQAVKKKDREKHPDLIDAMRTALKATGKPYVIENVPRAPLDDAFILCGSSFGLPIRRHRKFESNVFILAPPCCHEAFPAIYPPAHNRVNPLRVLSISGGHQRGVSLDEYKAATGIDWEITRAELSESIPPAYTEFIGSHLMEALCGSIAG